MSTKLLDRSAPVDRTASRLMAPYVAWRGFAGVLNEEIVRGDPHA
ncbi:MAG: hypothetical protein AVDCRST_MAG50-1963 [uncultured Acidimicrobiales bacterium]|uniref:Uncharacterized protein n=1 Tax=uncultured Acidimicrobiales bacterium TaxID=310071 RepID=A0A6J4IC18_9ACTN|nr:MAG: hypothetical protein AVDCRST_MAG50-1963 [uncultured Acidimicrobiales bacterium]